MEDIRFKQAQSLLEKAASRDNGVIKFNPPKSAKIDVKTFENIFKNIISAEDFIYRSLPSHNLSEEEAKEFIDFVIEARENIDSILSDFSVIEKKEEKIDIAKLTGHVLFITSKNNFKKTLKKLGVDVSRIVVASVPLHIDDMKEINPKIPESALEGIKTKVKHIHNDITKKKKTLNPKKTIVLAEDDINGQLLGKRAEEHYDAIVLLNNNLKDLTDLDLIEIIGKN
jgi:hypothetical protein